MNQIVVELPNGMFIRLDILKDLQNKLMVLCAENGLRFWELSYMARHPDYKLPERSLKDLSDRGLLGNEKNLFYLNQIAILYLVVGRDRKLRVINDDEFNVLVSQNTP